MSASGPLADLLASRSVDFDRHVHDLAERTYEGSEGRAACEQQFRIAVEIVAPVALSVLSAVNERMLHGTGDVRITGPKELAESDLWAIWELSWPELRGARNRFTGDDLPPVSIAAAFPVGFTHGHLVLRGIAPPRTSLAAWPLQVTSGADAERQLPIMWAIVEAEIHERIFAADVNWRVMPRRTSIAVEQTETTTGVPDRT